MFIEVLHKVLQFVFVFRVAVPLRNKGIVFCMFMLAQSQLGSG